MSDDDYPSRKLDMVRIRLPDGLKGHLQAAAETNLRRLNAECVYRLENHDRLIEGAEHLNEEIARLKKALVQLRQRAEDAESRLFATTLSPGVDYGLDAIAALHLIIKVAKNSIDEEGYRANYRHPDDEPAPASDDEDPT